MSVDLVAGQGTDGLVHLMQSDVNGVPEAGPTLKGTMTKSAPKTGK